MPSEASGRSKKDQNGNFMGRETSTNLFRHRRRDKWLGNLTPEMEATIARLKTFKEMNAAHNAVER